eukprot:6476038-Amphidinium_carterae.1
MVYNATWPSCNLHELHRYDFAILSCLLYCSSLEDTSIHQNDGKYPPSNMPNCRGFQSMLAQWLNALEKGHVGHRVTENFGVEAAWVGVEPVSSCHSAQPSTRWRRRAATAMGT